MLSILLNPLTKWAVVGFLVISLVTYYTYTVEEGVKTEIEMEGLKKGIQIRKKIDESIIHSPDTPDGNLEWLRRRSEAGRTR